MPGLKYHEEVWSRELFMAIGVALTTWVGMSISLAGISQLPKCVHGDPSCYFFVQVCDKAGTKFNSTEITCVWMPKKRKVEGNSASGLDQLTIPILSSVMGVVPGLGLVAATVIRNERSMFGILEFGKFLIGFNGLMLIVSCMMIDRMTFDCRWWGEQHHPDGAACKGGYAKFGVGTTFIFTTEFLLMCGSIVYTELERKRVDESKNFFSPDGTRTDAVRMNTQTTTMGTMGIG